MYRVERKDGKVKVYQDENPLTVESLVLRAYIEAGTTHLQLVFLPVADVPVVSYDPFMAEMHFNNDELVFICDGVEPKIFVHGKQMRFVQSFQYEDSPDCKPHIEMDVDVVVT